MDSAISQDRFDALLLKHQLDTGCALRATIKRCTLSWTSLQSCALSRAANLLGFSIGTFSYCLMLQQAIDKRSKHAWRCLWGIHLDLHMPNTFHRILKKVLRYSLSHPEIATNGIFV